jgi:hypothetical protein
MVVGDIFITVPSILSLRRIGSNYIPHVGEFKLLSKFASLLPFGLTVYNFHLPRIINNSPNYLVRRNPDPKIEQSMRSVKI